MSMDTNPEEAFVGMLLREPEKSFATLKTFPKRFWFADKTLGKICEALEKCDAKDAKTISQATKIPLVTIASLEIEAPLSLNIEAFAKEIFDNYKGREILKFAESWCNTKAFDKEFFESVEDGLEEIAKTTNGVHDLIFPERALTDWISDKEDRIAGKIKPLKIGYPSIDGAFAGGLHPELITVAGRPGSGKSALLKSMLLRCLKADYKAAVFSIEMVPNEYLDRLCSEWVGIDGMRLKNAVCLDDGELDRLSQFSRDLYSKKFSFNEMQSCNVIEIERLSKAAKVKLEGLDIIFIDHLHIMESHNSKLDTKQLLGDITRRLKRLSQVLKVPVVLAAQCNRDSEKRDNKRPKMSDLEGSGGIEQNSNAIIFVHRPGQYDEDISNSNAEVYITKNRHGPSNLKLNFRFVESQTAFEEIDL